MKRSGPIARRTPLSAGKPLTRSTPMASGSGMPRASAPIRARRPGKARRKNRDRPPGELAHGYGWDDVRLVIYVRAGGRCELCAKSLNIANMEGHHRRTRAVGPDCPCNALALCSTCHHDEVHAHPEEARARGWIVTRHASDFEPADVPVELASHPEGVLLTCEGMFAVQS